MAIVDLVGHFLTTAHDVSGNELGTGLAASTRCLSLRLGDLLFTPSQTEEVLLDLHDHFQSLWRAIQCVQSLLEDVRLERSQVRLVLLQKH